jgi:hypothetical protein
VKIKEGVAIGSLIAHTFIKIKVFDCSYCGAWSALSHLCAAHSPAFVQGLSCYAPEALWTQD